MLSLFRLFFLVLMLGPRAGGAVAQEIPEPPVRYDEDLLPASFHEDRRQAVLEHLPQDAVAVFFSNPVRNREGSVDYLYRQSSNMYYLTGSHEPETILVLAPAGMEVDGREVTEVLFVQPRDPHHEVWEGRLFGPERARQELGVEMALPHTRFEEVMGPIFRRGDLQILHDALPAGVVEGTPLHAHVSFFRNQVRTIETGLDQTAQQIASAMFSVDDPRVFARIKQIARENLTPGAFADPLMRDAYTVFLASGTMAEWHGWMEENLRGVADGSYLPALLDALRTVKTEEELELMRRAIDITVAAHREVMRSIEPGMKEYEVSALAEFIFHRNGAQYTAFPTIVASGENSVILHYTSRRRTMRDGDIVVIDMGAEYHGYAADVTRTLPVNGRFSEEQRAIYEIVLEAQDAGIEAAVAGASFGAADQAARPIVARGLMELGLIGSENEVGRFFMHGTSHYLGLNVHDSMGSDTLVPNAVLTVEPGIYIAPAEDIDPRWWNIGVRIEDDILVTEDGPVNLSAGAPRTVEEIEALMREVGTIQAEGVVVE